MPLWPMYVMLQHRPGGAMSGTSPVCLRSVLEEVVFCYERKSLRMAVWYISSEADGWVGGCIGWWGGGDGWVAGSEQRVRMSSFTHPPPGKKKKDLNPTCWKATIG